MRKILGLCFVLGLFGCTSVPMSSMESSKDWRTPDKEDVINDWAVYDSPNKIVADFNNDNLLDLAQILLSSKNNIGYMLAVDMGGMGLIHLEENNEIPAQSVAIELLTPSNEVFESACQKGYWDCGPNEIRQFKITKPSIQFCFIESACSVYLWSDKNKNFIKIPLSD